MVPSEIRNQSLKQLRHTFLSMTSAEWDLALEGKPEKVVSQAAKNLLTVQRARLRLQNAELSTIREKLIENEIALEAKGQRVSGALKNLQEVEVVLEAVSSFLGVVARVVALL